MVSVRDCGAIDGRMLAFVRGTIAEEDTHATALATRFPFRNRFHHCVRVALLALDIARAEGADLDVAAVGGLFHDCGKSAGRDHAEVSAECCRLYLEQNQLLAQKIDRIVDCVRHHSAAIDLSRGAYPQDLAVLRDADLLDEVGATGVTWTLLAIGAQEPGSYNEALTKLIGLHASPVPEGRLGKMRTATGRALVRQRIDREQRFVEELAAELQVDRFVPDGEAS